MIESPGQYTSAENIAQVNKILEVILAYARLDFSQKISFPAGNNDVLDAISGGVNMLGEELQVSTLSLREKEQLLKEIHHRVKNNLQIVSSLLNLQSAETQDPKFLSMVRESRNRIYSMALVHEMLYASRNLSHISIDEYIRRLSQTIHQTFIRADQTIDFQYDIDPELTFDIDHMVPIGLILNEIISNAMKYAFPRSNGCVSICFRAEDDGYLMEAWDNGVGLPEYFTVDTDANLGMQLIFMLAEQLDGSAELMQISGTGFRIRFPKKTI